MFRKHAGQHLVAIARIESAGVGVAILKVGSESELLINVAESLPLEDRTKEALRLGILQTFSAAADKAVAEYAKFPSHHRVTSCYCVIGAPWTRSFAGSAHTELGTVTVISDEMIGSLAKQALAQQHDIESANLLEANVSRVLLNGYAVADPAKKRASEIDVYTLISDCDPDIRKAAAETLSRAFPETSIVWRSSARAMLAAAKKIDPVETCLIVHMDGEATDLISVRKGVIAQRMLVDRGFRQIMGAIAGGKLPEETMSHIDMLEKEQSDTGVADELRDAIAKAEPELVHLFGEALAKLSVARKLPDEMIIVAPAAISPWLSRFFSRIDFTQFTATTKPFVVKTFPVGELAGLSRGAPAAPEDPSLSIASCLVNTELAA